MYTAVANQVRDLAVRLSALNPDQAAKILEEATPEQIEQAKREMGKMATLIEAASPLANIALALTLLFGAAHANEAAQIIKDVKKQESIPAAQVKAQKPGARERAEKKLKQMLEVGNAQAIVDSLLGSSAQA